MKISCDIDFLFNWPKITLLKLDIEFQSKINIRYLILTSQEKIFIFIFKWYNRSHIAGKRDNYCNPIQYVILMICKMIRVLFSSKCHSDFQFFNCIAVVKFALVFTENSAEEINRSNNNTYLPASCHCVSPRKCYHSSCSKHTHVKRMRALQRPH